VPARQRLLAAVAGLTGGMPLLTPARSIPQMLAAALAARVRNLADFIAGYALVDQLVPGAALTEEFTWLIAATGIGIADGSSAGGLAADLVAARAAFLVAAAAALLAASIALMGRRWLHSPVGAHRPGHRQ
jgi:predicted MFS family arabinose efflux permease